MPRRHLDGEEVRGGQHLPVQLQKLRPAHARLPPLRGGLQVMTTQDIAHGNFVYSMSQIGQRPLDAPVAPRRILFRHAQDELLHLLGDTRPAQLAALLTAVKLLGDQSLVPAQKRVWRGDGGDLFQARAPEGVGERREAAALGLGQAQPAPAQLEFEDTVFLEEIGDDLLLVPLEPAGDHGDEDMQDHRIPQVGSRDVMVCSSILSS